MFYENYNERVVAKEFMYRVYGWMAAGLATTAAVALYIGTTPSLYGMIFGNPGLPLVLFMVQIGIVIGLSAGLSRISFATAALLFFLYALSVGVTTSVIFLVYTKTSIYSTFLVTAGMFGLMSLYGYTTGADLTSVGSFSLMALLGLILTGIINMFLKSPMVHFLMSGFGVFIFVLFTAYDTQKIKNIAYELIADREMIAKVALMGALTLYLDFINLFLYLLQFLGKRRQD